MDRTRRGLLAALLGVGSGCLGFGGDDEVTPVPVDTTAPRTATTRPPTATPARTATRTPTATRTGTATETQTASPTATATQTPSPTETPTPSPTATPTPRGAQAPPPGSLVADEPEFTVEATPDGPVCDVRVRLRNRGDVVFTVVELRVEVRYDPVANDPFLAGVGYLRERFDGFGSGSRQLADTFGLTDSRIDGREPDDRFDLTLQYRGVEYRAP